MKKAKSLIDIDSYYFPNEIHEFLLNFLYGEYFPWYYGHTVDPEVTQYFHNVCKRNDQGLPVEGEPNSDIYNVCRDLFEIICIQEKIQWSKIFRMAFNSTTAFKKPNAGFHTDHDFPHRVLIYYLSSANGDTIIRHKDKTMNIKPIKFRLVVFNGLYEHTILSPDIGDKRIVFVVTFD